jgi:hypothetical protein
MGTSQGNTPNILAVTQLIANETLSQLKNNMAMLNLVNRSYDSNFGKKGEKIGDTVMVRIPNQFQGGRGPNANIEGMQSPLVPVTISTQYNVAVEYSSYELLLSLDYIKERYAAPMSLTISNSVDSDLLSLASGFPTLVGTPGTVANSRATYLAAKTALDNNGLPIKGMKRNMVINSNTESAVVLGDQAFFNAQQRISDEYEDGRMGRRDGFDWYMDQNTSGFTSGPQGGTPVVNGANQTGNAIVVSGFTAAAGLRLRKGETVRFPGSFQTNAVNNSTGSKTPLSNLMQFNVTADVFSDGAGNATIPISPQLTVTGAYQTVSAAPLSGGAITLDFPANTFISQGLAFAKDAIAFVNVDLPDVSGAGAACSFATDKDTGLRIRVSTQWNILNDINVMRCDLLGGCNILRPEYAVRIASL